MRLLDPFLYEKVHELVVLVITLYYFIIFQQKNAEQLIYRNSSRPIIFVYAILFIIVVGFRPISFAFGDTVNYARGYQDFSSMAERVTISTDTLFYSFMWLCSQYMSVNWFFFIIEIFYVVPLAIGCYRLFKKNTDIALLFCFSAFSFFSYSVNGIRNGVSLNLVLLALTYIQGNKLDKILCGALSILAIAIHTSAALPVICMFSSLFFIKKPHYLFYFWGLSILISLVGGNAVANIFASLGFDERLSEYIHPDIEEDLYTVTGFRWDFLLYSFAPILLGLYVIFKKRVFNPVYVLLLGTYILANAFWVMIIRAEFSNRFAYLSWFLYPLVLVYPLLKLKIWPKTQGHKAVIIMMGHLAFTLLMVFIL